MKPLSIADYLDHLGRPTEEKTPPRREGSPFRPRSLPIPQNAKPALKAVFDRLANAGGADEKPSEAAPRARAMDPEASFARPCRARIAADRRAGSSPTNFGAAHRRLCSGPRARAGGGPRRGLRSPCSRTRRCEGAGRDAAAGVSSPRMRAVRRRDPRPGSSRSRTMSGAPSLAFSRRFCRSSSSNGLWRSWPKRLPGPAQAVRPH